QEKEIPITTSSDEAKKLFLKGRDKFELIEFAASVQYFEQAIEKDPNFALAHLFRFRTGVGGAEVTQGYLAKAVALVDKVSKGEKYLILYSKALVDGEGTKQKENLDKLLELFPSDKRVQYLAGMYFGGIERDFETALQYYRRVTELDNTFAPVYNNIGYTSMTLGNFAEAEKAFVEQIKLVPNRPNPYDSYAELLIRMGRYDESIAQYKKALGKDASFLNAFFGVGDNYIFKGEYETARKNYEMVYEKAPHLVGLGGKFNALDRIASSFVLEGKISEALNTCERYRTLAKENNRTGRVINSYQNEGFILTESGNPAEGIQRYRMATEIAYDPKTPEAVKNNLALVTMFQECYALMVNKEMEAALTKMEDCKKLAQKRQVPGDQRWMSYLNGIAETQKGNYTQALEHYSNSWPTIPIIKYYMAVAYEKKGDQEKAGELFEELQNRKQNTLQVALVKYRMKKMAAK
ncbi:MAG: tetratricopeptide repeat protein, partial [bacterium]